ncbi:hypothetical protein [Kineosporia sp. R_H_3]|uniref:hypothetical protein n=1 Tax=Kineosporia sp. R_H_3 TaxID=1961848 RepID=UPI000B4AF25D|nr:hypothetical protein [Kineosporia sp. R_H_3]
MRTTIVLPVSRADYLDRVFYALEMLTCDAKRTGLLVLVDGDQELVTTAQTYVEQSKSAERRCVQRDDRSPVTHGIPERRQRIANILNELKTMVTSEYVFGLEDDTIVPRMALQRLYETYALFPHAGFVSGVELGRWGIAHVGAWLADNVYETISLKTPPMGEGIQPVDAAGFYCFLTKTQHYRKHTFKPYEDALGPDVDFGLALRRNGYQNYLNWSVACEHRRKDDYLKLGLTPLQEIEVKLEGGEWKVWI